MKRYKKIKCALFIDGVFFSSYFSIHKLSCVYNGKIIACDPFAKVKRSEDTFHDEPPEEFEERSMYEYVCLSLTHVLIIDL